MSSTKYTMIDGAIIANCSIHNSTIANTKIDNCTISGAILTSCTFVGPPMISQDTVKWAEKAKKLLHNPKFDVNKILVEAVGYYLMHNPNTGMMEW